MSDQLAPRHSAVTLRAAWWTLRAVRRARRDLRERGLATEVKAPPALPWGARRGVRAVLHRTDPTCLERALVLQAWLAAHDRRRDVVIGVAMTDGEFKAHAWVENEGTDLGEAHGYSVIHRIPP